MSGRHDALIDHWAARLGLRTGGFKLGVADMLRQAPWCDEPDAEDILQHLNAQRVVPDAWGIRVEGPDDFWCRPVLVIETLEARVTHPTSPEALRWYDQLWWMCDGSDAFELRVFEVSDFDEVRILVGIDAVLGRIQERLPARDRDALPTPTRDGAA